MREQTRSVDTVILKNTFYDADAPAGQQLTSICTNKSCGRAFLTTFRRMGAGRHGEVRNVAQCPACRARYPHKPKGIRAGDRVRVLEGSHSFAFQPGDELVVGAVAGSGPKALCQLIGCEGQWFAERFEVVARGARA